MVILGHRGVLREGNMSFGLNSAVAIVSCCCSIAHIQIVKPLGDWYIDGHGCAVPSSTLSSESNVEPNKIQTVNDLALNFQNILKSLS